MTNQTKYSYLSHFVTPNSVKSLHLIINNANGYIKENNENKYLALVANGESKDTLNKYEKILKKIKELIRLPNKNSSNYDEKYMKIKFNSYDDDLPMKKH